MPDAIDAYREGVAKEDFDVDTVLVGEAVGIIHDVAPAAEMLTAMVRDAARIVNRPNG
ncbi:MAG: hypothetical protein K2X97_10280 [Mycobacteriaceae bacterium]|nr:hypothetical protein [Mycobacteriaceae bacterium]